MDPVLFGAKRAYYATLRYGREVLAPFGVTPARFEVLHLLFGRTEAQAYLRSQLGVARSTLSRMLSVLEGLGWIVREVAVDRRTRFCSLTVKGEALVHGVVHLIRRHTIRDTVNRALHIPSRTTAMAVFHRLRDAFAIRYHWSRYWRRQMWQGAYAAAGLRACMVWGTGLGRAHVCGPTIAPWTRGDGASLVVHQS